MRQLTMGSLAMMLGSLSEEELEAFSLELPSHQLGGIIIAAKEIRVRAARLETFLEVRYSQECSQQLYQAPDGKRYIFRASRTRELGDVGGLRDELNKLSMDGIQRNLMERAFKREPQAQPWKVDHGYLNQLASRSKEAAEVIRSFRGWKEGIPHLELLDEVRRG